MRLYSVLYTSSLFLVAVQASDCEQVYLQVEYDLKDFPAITIGDAATTVQTVVKGQLNTDCIKSTDEPHFDPCWASKDGYANTWVCGFRLYRVLKKCNVSSQLDNAFIVWHSDGSFSTPWTIIDTEPVGDVHCDSQ